MRPPCLNLSRMSWTFSKRSIGFPPQNEETRLVSVGQAPYLSLGEDRGRRRLAPHLQERSIVEDREVAEIHRLGERSHAINIRPDGNPHSSVVKEAQVRNLDRAGLARSSGPFISAAAT